MAAIKWYLDLNVYRQSAALHSTGELESNVWCGCMQGWWFSPIMNRNAMRKQCVGTYQNVFITTRIFMSVATRVIITGIDYPRVTSHHASPSLAPVFTLGFQYDWYFLNFLFSV
jgi:hypothetical protein